MKTVTMYLRKIPEEIARAAKSAAALEGKSLSAWITETVGGKLAGLEQVPESGFSLSIVIPRDLADPARAMAIADAQTLDAWVEEAIKEKVGHNKAK